MESHCLYLCLMRCFAAVQFILELFGITEDMMCLQGVQPDVFSFSSLISICEKILDMGGGRFEKQYSVISGDIHKT